MVLFAEFLLFNVHVFRSRLFILPLSRNTIVYKWRQWNVEKAARAVWPDRRELNVVYCICHCTMCLGHSFFQSALQDNLFKITKVEA